MSVPAPVLAAVEATLEQAVGRPLRIRNSSPLGGGCINPSARLTVEGGESFFLKWNDAAASEMFGAEADGLQALAATGALRVPEVMGWGGSGVRDDPGWLLLEFIPTGAPGPDYGRKLGEGLSRLHEGGGSPWPSFGWHRDNFIGSLPQLNEMSESWAEFWRDLRIAPQLARARGQGYFTGPEGELLDRLMERMDELLPVEAVQSASLLHGDLWNGNYFPDAQGTPVLIDPAVYRGDGEVELAMMELFGHFPRGFEKAYDAAHGISPEYRSHRRDLYQLYYLLVHVNLFGKSYLGGSVGAARRALQGL